MKTSSEFRSEARAALSGKWGSAALFCFVCMFVAAGISVVWCWIPLGSLAASLITMPIGYGMTVGLLRQLRGNELQMGWMFQNFNGRIWCTLILQFIYTVLWTLLLFIPGLVKSYSYALTPFILEDEPELANNAAIERSMAMMKGHKWDLFVLDLTFIGWYLLGILTLGIACFWVMPYRMTARAAFYEELKKQG